MSDPFRMRGLTINAEAFLRAYDLFGDHLVRRYLARERLETQAKQEFEIKEIKEEILGNEIATPWHRAQALYGLITGFAPAEVTKALYPERAAA